MSKVLGFRSGKTPWHKTPLPNVIAVYDRDPKRHRNAHRVLYRVRRWNAEGQPIEIYKPTIRGALLIFAQWRWHKARELLRRGWRSLGSKNAGDEK